MKKRIKHKRYSAPKWVEPDIVGLINKMQEQLVSLEKKIDALVSQFSGRPVERKHFSEPFQRVEHSHRRGEEKQGNGYRERTLYKAICADCNKECEVPFKPSEDRPVYCKECFSKRKRRDSFKEKSDYMPNQGVEKRTFAEKKRPNVFRRKKHARSLFGIARH